MAYDEQLATQIASVLKHKGVSFEAKKMFGGMAFMVDAKMCVGVVGDELMARIGEEAYEDALEREGAKPMMFTGRAMKGFVFVEPEVLEDEQELMYWVQLCLNFNPIAKSSKKKK